MKKVFSTGWQLLVALISLLAGSQNTAQAQPGNVPRVFKDWNWEEPKFDPNKTVRKDYRDTWTANLTSGTNGTQMIDAPWAVPNSPALQAINLSSDYKKADGWELIRFDFGALGVNQTPYFILYHKPTGVLRIYAYMSVSNFPTSILFTLSHSPNDKTYPGHSPASLGTSRSLVVAPDKYLTQPSPTTEVLNYVGFSGGGASWSMGQFTILFDPSTSNSNFNLSSYQIQIFGVTSSTVHLNGSLQYQTQNKDFSFSTSPDNVQKDPGTGALTILTKGQKYLGDLSSFGDKLNDIKKNADDFKGLIGSSSGPYKSLYDVSNGASKLAGNNALKGITSAAATLGGVFGLAGSIISMFSDDAGGSSFVPTYSKGTISLDGTITTTAPLRTFFLFTPGANHYRANSGTTTTPQNLYQQLPYYNCPLGIFNIQNTPVLMKVDYKRAGGLHYNSAQYSSPDDILKHGTYLSDKLDALYCTSYTITNDIKPIVNAQSGLEIVSVKFAIGQRFPLQVLSQPYTDSRYNYYGNSYSYNRIRRYSFMYSQVASGALEAYPDDAVGGSARDATIIIQTPFMDAACMGSALTIPFNTASATPTPDNPVFVRVVAELRPVGNLTATHTYFSQDYAFDAVDSPATQYWALPQDVAWEADKIPPYHIYSLYPGPANFYEPDVVKYGNLGYDNNTPGEVANNTLLFAAGSSVSVNTSPGNTVLFHAAGSIGIEGELTAPSGKELVISTDFKSVYPNPYAYYCDAQFNPGNAYAVANQACNYDPDATRVGSALVSGNAPAPGVASSRYSLPELTVSPNPATSSTLAQLTVPDEECIQRAELLTLAGQVSWQQAYDCTHTLAAPVPLRGLPTGLYVLRVTTSSHIYTTKVSVE